VDSAPREDVETVRANLESLNPAAPVSECVLRLAVDAAPELRGRRVLVIEDGPTITHGGMASGAGLRAAGEIGATPIDPRQWSVGSIRQAYEEYPHIGPVLPALGYGDNQLRELEETIAAVPSDAVVIASPVDLRRLVTIERPAFRVTYDVEITEGPSVEDILAPLKRAGT
jgi:predicted GTPase